MPVNEPSFSLARVRLGDRGELLRDAGGQAASIASQAGVNAILVRRVMKRETLSGSRVNAPDLEAIRAVMQQLAEPSRSPPAEQDARKKWVEHIDGQLSVTRAAAEQRASDIEAIGRAEAAFPGAANQVALALAPPVLPRQPPLETKELGPSLQKIRKGLAKEEALSASSSSGSELTDVKRSEATGLRVLANKVEARYRSLGLGGHAQEARELGHAIAALLSTPPTPE